jgi:predicted  nucleic acid-binding Zn-ribbon protein
MTAVPRQRGQILILLAAYYFFGGAASSILLYLQANSPRDLKKAVASVVTDEARKDAAQSEIDYWAKLLKSQTKDLAKSQKKIVKLARQHDATRPQFDRITADMDESVRKMDSRFLDARFRIKGHVTQAEWTAMWAGLKQGG